MSTIRTVGLGIGAVALAATLIASSPQKPKYTLVTHEVVAGESVSLICIRHYGRYSPAMGKAILKDNPELKDLNSVRKGQTLKLRKPVPEKTAASEEEKLFIKSVDATQGVVTFVSGKARITRAGKATTLAVNSEVFPGDVLETGPDGCVELIVNRESVIRMKANTRVNVQSFRDNKTKEGKTTVKFSLGTVWTRVKSFKDKVCRFELELPNAIAGVHGTVYQTQVAGDNSAEVKVYHGEVQVKGQPKHAGPQPSADGEVAGPHEVAGPQEVSMEEWIRIIRDMQRISITPEGTPSEPKKFEKQKDDEWEHFNEARDRAIADIVARF